jgi:Pyridoxamine 5'-phosphate oxidase
MSEPAAANHPHAQLDELPSWPGKTVAMLATGGPRPHVIPVSAPVRANGRTILLSLRRTRGSLARLRDRPAVALLFLAEGDIAFTAHGTAQVVEEPMAVAVDYAAVQIAVQAIDDHRQAEFHVTGGVDRSWIDDQEQRALRERVQALNARAADMART